MSSRSPNTEQPATASPARRPLGLSLAIAATALLYGVVPLLEGYFLWRLSATADEAFLIGGTDTDAWVTAEAIFGGVVLVLCWLTWWGHPPQIRYILITAILIATAINLYRIGEAWFASEDLIFGGQTQAAVRDALRCQLPAFIVVPLYVIWYINRAPARAFFRGVPLTKQGQPQTD